MTGIFSKMTRQGIKKNIKTVCSLSIFVYFVLLPYLVANLGVTVFVPRCFRIIFGFWENGGDNYISKQT